MLRLDSVSKFYSTNGLVSTGFSKVSLEFKIGEFVAITGESGSGKSTLLNVISGLDSFEEGEMYIMDKPTSGFSKEDLEDYRKRYIGNIFQSFNLINSYTVYQNVELILLMSGYSKKAAEPIVKEIIGKVGLAEYENSKASKLSGGQKQRVAIARALAKETPIIVADEPTGNLDSKSATEIIELLHELSKDKLIIIVTHNYDQVEKYVTRKISMHDGRVAEDKKFNTQSIETTSGEIKAEPATGDTLTFGNMARLSVRNTFNIPAKFLLLLVVFLFLCAGTIAEYSSYLNMDDSSDGVGWNDYFVDTGKDRILVTKSDGLEFTDVDYKKLSDIENVKSIVKDDLTLDLSTSLYSEKDDDGIYISAGIQSVDGTKDRLVDGRLPENAREAILIFDKDSEYMVQQIDKIYNNKMKISNDMTGNDIFSKSIKIVGYAYTTKAETDALNNGQYYHDGIVAFNDAGMAAVRNKCLERYCTQEIILGDSITSGNSANSLYPLVATNEVPKGKLYIPDSIGSRVSYPQGRDITIVNKSLYFQDEFKYQVGAVVDESNCEYFLGIKSADFEGNSIYINPKDYNKIFNKGNFQSSVKVNDDKEIGETISAIKKAGYNTFRVNDGVIDGNGSYKIIINTFRTILLVVVLVVLFFITYFITKLIMKSRNTYFTTIRMIGGTKSNCNNMIRAELFVVFNIAYFLCIIGAILINLKVINIEYLYKVITFLTIPDYAILYVVLCLMSLILASRYARALFKKTAMRAHAEEV